MSAPQILNFLWPEMGKINDRLVEQLLKRMSLRGARSATWQSPSNALAEAQYQRIPKSEGDCHTSLRAGSQ